MKIAGALVLSLGGISIFASCTMPEQPPPPRPQEWTSPLGASCSRNSDCAIGMNCDRSAPAGSCFKPCSTAADCGSGAICSKEKCLPGCEKNTDCRAGFACEGKGNKSCKTINEPEKGVAVDR